ncbi:MAG: hypothetical protein AAB853_02925 [Patescibacteria group bacterium]
MNRKHIFYTLGIVLLGVSLMLILQRQGMLLASVGAGINLIQDVDVAQGTLREKIVDIINFALSFVALFAIVVIIIAGFMLLFSFGSETTIQRAKKVIIYAVVGLLVIFFAVVIVSFFTQELPAIFT